MLNSCHNKAVPLNQGDECEAFGCLKTGEIRRVRVTHKDVVGLAMLSTPDSGAWVEAGPSLHGACRVRLALG